ncbi:MAG: hypothetical protein ABI539_05800 [Acidobacteriota bacterium]
MARTLAKADTASRDKEPIDLGDHAADNLRFIRETMERATHFTGVPGWGGMLMGATAIAAAFQANYQADRRDWLLVWLIEAALAFAIGVVTMWQKSKFVAQPISSAVGRKFVNGFAPPLIAGAIVTLGLWRYDQYEIMAPVWMVLYGAAVICGGAFSVRVVPVMGWIFMALGGAAFILPAANGNLMMGLSFGLLHIVFGAIIARKYGG